MIDCINTHNGAIGYMESGLGWSEGLREIGLENKEGTFITSQEAFVKGGIASAASEVSIPSNVEDDWGGVEFIDKVS